MYLFRHLSLDSNAILSSQGTILKILATSSLLKEIKKKKEIHRQTCPTNSTYTKMLLAWPLQVQEA